MLTYVTGAIGSGKTALMLRLNNKLKREGADGFVCPKVYYGGEFQGYDLVRLGDSGRVTFARLGDFYEGGFTEPFFFDRFVFEGECFSLGTRILEEALANKGVRHVFVDEIGPLELDGRGFKEIIKMLSNNLENTGKDFYISVRESCLKQLDDALGSPPSRIIRPEQPD